MIDTKALFWRLQPPPKKNGYVIWLYDLRKKSKPFNEPDLKMTATTTLKSFNYLSLINHRLNHNSYAILSSPLLPRSHPASTSFSNSGFRFFQSNHLFCKFSSLPLFGFCMLHVRRNVLKIRAFHIVTLMIRKNLNKLLFWSEFILKILQHLQGTQSVLFLYM